MPKYTREHLDSIYDEALHAKDEGDLDKAFELFMRGALLDDPHAQNAVALAYSDGEGIKQDKNEAIRWLKKSLRIEQQPGYCSNIAIVYSEMGKRRQAEYWWQKAVALGNGDAALTYAKFLLKVSGRYSPKVITLLKFAKNSREGWKITADGREEAIELLEKSKGDKKSQPTK